MKLIWIDDGLSIMNSNVIMLSISMLQNIKHGKKIYLRMYEVFMIDIAFLSSLNNCINISRLTRKRHKEFRCISCFI